MQMMNSDVPDPNVVHPIAGCDSMTYVKPTIRNPNISVGDFTYIADADFESHVTHHYEFNHDRLVIGKFCQIAHGVEFVMNGANHQMNAVSTYPFFVFPGWSRTAPSSSDMPLKGDTVVGNDVWIGQGATILPGVHIGDGAIVGLGSVVASDVPPYTIVAGNPAREIRRRLDDELVGLMLELKWWDMDVREIKAMAPILTCGDLDRVKTEVRKMLARR